MSRSLIGLLAIGGIDLGGMLGASAGQVGAGGMDLGDLLGNHGIGLAGIGECVFQARGELTRDLIDAFGFGRDAT